MNKMIITATVNGNTIDFKIPTNLTDLNDIIDGLDHFMSELLGEGNFTALGGCEYESGTPNTTGPNAAGHIYVGIGLWDENDKFIQ